MITAPLFAGDCIRTNSGLYMNVFETTMDMISIEDIAHALAHQCRFAGHVPVFYSVAQHAVECFKRASKENKFQALMHDASEAYLVDIPSPIKKHLSEYKVIEHKLMLKIAERFGFEWPMTEEVAHIDLEMLKFEWDYVKLQNELPEESDFVIMTSEEAKEAFLSCFYEMMELKALELTVNE